MGKYTLIFDGDCGFCSTVSRVIERRSAGTATPIEIAPWQWTDLASVGLTEAQAAEQVWLVERVSDEAAGQHIRVFGGHECLAKLAELHGSWASKLVSRLMLAKPLVPISRWVYKFTAKNRHRLPGGTPACKMPRS